MSARNLGAPYGRSFQQAEKEEKDKSRNSTGPVPPLHLLGEPPPPSSLYLQEEGMSSLATLVTQHCNPALLRIAL